MRPEDLGFSDAGLPVTVTDATFLGDRVRRTLRLPDGAILRASGRPGDAGRCVGAETHVGFAAADAVILPA